jgi:gliding motility-associated-like protein
MKKILFIFILVLGTTSVFSQSNVDVPNVFTPNNDGVNDFFKIRTNGYETLRCTIYDRYGSVVYEFFGLNGSWDGRTHAGMECSNGTYFVILNLGVEGGESKSFQGDLQLLR